MSVVLAGALAVGAPSATGQANAGGAFSSPVPRLTDVRCLTECSGVAYTRPGSVVALSGRDLDAIELVGFLGRKAAGDEVVVEPERVGARRLTVRVPRGAVSGPVAVTNGDGATSAPSHRRLQIENVATRRVSSGPGPGIEIAVSGRKVFFDGERQPAVTYLVRDPQAVHVVVEVVRVADGVPVVRFDQGLVTPNEPRSVTWDGTVNGVVQPEGRYEFRVYAENSQGVRASSSQAAPDDPAAPASPDSFVLLGHKFPVRGAHDYGGERAAFGGGRGHQGQDVFASCGTPLVAARGGVVKMRRFHSRAGHYLVIDGEQTDVDYIYMHLRDAALVEKGARVHTGQLIGYVGDTGRAHGCHLHFELWSGPGWYTGGQAFDPLPELKAWDRFS